MILNLLRQHLDVVSVTGWVEVAVLEVLTAPGGQAGVECSVGNWQCLDRDDLSTRVTSS